jgi:hypothetical protein
LSRICRARKLAQLSMLILGTDEPTSVPELFAALRGFGHTDRVLDASGPVDGPFGCVRAEGVGFEPTETRNASPVFKTGAIGH